MNQKPSCSQNISKRTRVKKLIILTLAVLLLTESFRPSTKAFALNIIPYETKMYTTSGTPVFAVPDVTSKVILYMDRFVNVTVTGITENGFYQIDLNGKYYIPGIYLISQVNPAQTDKQKVLEKLKEIATAYQIQLEQMASYSPAFGLLDITGDGIPELFDSNKKEIYTYHEGHSVMLYYAEYANEFYYSKKDNVLVGKYYWNNKEICEVFYRDTSLLPWGQLQCYTTDASPYAKNLTYVSMPYTNDASNRGNLYNTLHAIVSADTKE